ncbi:MAG: PIN domain-containing protein [Acidobacteria bacterium]|nr:PIN domain-containing protein [Acidobacteriota bacterium]
MIALDTNLLVYAHRSALPEHQAARRAIEKASRNRAGWAIPAFCAAEFWAVATHPSSSGRPSREEEAEAFLAGLFQAGAQVLQPREGFVARLTRLACDLRIRGPRIFDLQIALVSLEGGAGEIWTHDRRFASLPGLPIRDPL